jgi:hypothetical protein
LTTFRRCNNVASEWQWNGRRPLTGKVLERASDEILRPMQLRSEPAAKNQQKHARFACSGACSPLLCFCSRPCYSPARFSGNADFIGSPGAIGYQIPCKFPVLYRAEANKIGACKLRLCSCKLDAPKRIDVSLLDVKKARAFTRAGGCRLTIRATGFGVLPKRTQRTNPERFEHLIFDL